MSERKDIKVPAGWVAFWNAATKRATGISYFKSEGRAWTNLSITVAPTKEELLARLQADGVEPPLEAP